MLISRLRLVPSIAKVFDPHRINKNQVSSQFEFDYDRVPSLIHALIELMNLCGMTQQDLTDELLFVVDQMADTTVSKT